MARSIAQLQGMVLQLDTDPNRSDWTVQKQQVFTAYAQNNISAREMLQLIEDIDDRVVKASMRGMSWITKILVKTADFLLAAARR